MTKEYKEVPEKRSEFPWNAIVVDDDPMVIEDISDYFRGKAFAGHSISFKGIDNWDEDFSLVRDRKVDLVVLDIYRGQATTGGDRAGERVLEQIKLSGFAPIIIYTNLAEGLEPEREEFVRLVLKADGLPQLAGELESLFDTKVPLMHRAIVNHLDRALRDYMWGFVTKNWPNLKTLADKPEFLRLLLQRLALSFVREGVGEAMAEVFGKTGSSSEGFSETVHPAEFYIKPPVGTDPLLGDVRLRPTEQNQEYLVVLWPSCDMVSTGGRAPKTNTVLCAKAILLDLLPETKKYLESQSKSATKQLTELLKNNRDTNLGTPDRFHFLPGILDIPNLVVDFQELERLTLEEVRNFTCLGSLSSPYAEHLASRFTRYLGRLGTPDANLQVVIASLAPMVVGNLVGTATGATEENKKQYDEIGAPAKDSKHASKPVNAAKKPKPGPK